MSFAEGLCPEPTQLTPGDEGQWSASVVPPALIGLLEDDGIRGRDSRLGQGPEVQLEPESPGRRAARVAGRPDVVTLARLDPTRPRPSPCLRRRR